MQAVRCRCCPASGLGLAFTRGALQDKYAAMGKDPLKANKDWQERQQMPGQRSELLAASAGLPAACQLCTVPDTRPAGVQATRRTGKSATRPRSRRRTTPAMVGPHCRHLCSPLGTAS